MRSKRIGTVKDLRSDAVATELGYMWAGLLQRGVMDPHRRIGFCSIGDDEGSHTLVANLALFVGQRDRKVALVESSLRNPALAAMFEASTAPGLAELLAGRAELADALRMAVAPGVDLVPAGDSTDPFWAFTSERFRGALDQLLATRDLCLVDLPGLEKAPEARLAIAALDAVVLVVEANRHRSRLVARNVAHLRSLGVPFLGVVMTELVHAMPTVLARFL